jgi:hypothetical protein
MNKIILITNHSSLAKMLKSHFSGLGKSIIHCSLPLKEALPSLENDDVLVIQEPVFINNNYLSASLCWKNFLKLHSPKTVLLNAGFGNGQDENYLDLLELAEDVGEALFNARMVDEEWVPITTGGVDVSKKLHRFFEGHGDESVTDELNKMLRLCKIARDELKIHEAEFAEVKNELLLPNKLPHKWNVLQSRWQFYIAYFQSLPYYRDFERLGEILKTVAPFFNGGCEDEDLFWTTNCVERLEQLKSGLEKIENSYVR